MSFLLIFSFHFQSREDALLYDPILSSEHNKERVAVVIAHELAHQWFGDLVTLRWWTDLWLNEGFATYVEYLGTDSVSIFKYQYFFFLFWFKSFTYFTELCIIYTSSLLPFDLIVFEIII